MSQVRLFRVAAIFLFCMVILWLRLLQLQVFEHEHWVREAQRSRSSLRSVPFARGPILDAEGRYLAKDIRACDLVFEYRAFRRGHLAGQLFEALTLLGQAPGGLASCWSHASSLGAALLAVRPEHLASLPEGTEGDFLFYLRRLAGIPEERVAEIQTWSRDGEQSFGLAFPVALPSFQKRLAESKRNWQRLEAELPGLMEELETERRGLEWWVRQRALREAAGRAFGLTAWQVLDRLRDGGSDTQLMQRLAERWQLRSDGDTLLELRSRLTQAPKGEDWVRQHHFDALGALLRHVETTRPNDLVGARRRVVRDVHRNRVIRLRREIAPSLVDLLAREVNQWPGLHPQETMVRTLDPDSSPHLVGRLRSPSREEVLHYRELRGDYRRLSHLLDRTASEEGAFLELRDRLRQTELLPGERVAASGLEWRFRDILRGQRGWLEALRVDRGEVEELGFSPARDGLPVRLALQTDWMLAAEEAIRTGYRIARHRLRMEGRLDALEATRVPRCGFVLLDLRDGTVPVLATAPSYTEEERRWAYGTLASNRRFSPLRHRGLAGGATAEQTPYPGSTFKLVAAVEALAQDPQWWDRTLRCDGVWSFSGSAGRPLHCEGVHGDIAMLEAIRHSCNIYFYRLADTLGYESLYHRARSFGFGQPSGLELTSPLDEDGVFQLGGPNRLLEGGGNYLRPPEEIQGRVPAMHLAIGQAHITTSPLQLARFYGWLATGDLWTPRLVREIGGKSTTASREVPSLPSSLRLLLRRALVQVVEHPAGTAHDPDYPLFPWRVAGKTGTAQVGKDSRNRPLLKHAWFAGYFPHDEPRWAVSILCEGADLHGGELATLVLEDFLARVGPEFMP